ncbi:MAG: glycosyltransferase [Candidatus Moranbacteria bacterium CG_4_8_14_3_um_filter_41_13]|nr:MAG: glycosyltransferase [Candidatus Moranbacteria bacterium CG_4_8_14_3_um_filter_41_13]
MREIAIVVPVYREAGNLPLLYTRLKQVTSGLADIRCEYIFVNDGSPDNSLDVLSGIAANDKQVKVIDLSRNFGKEIALTAGVHAAKHVCAVICMDADLQHPPEFIPQLIEEWQKGAEIVATKRISIEKQPLLRKVGSYLYYWLMSKISGLKIVSQTTDFRLYDKKVIEAFCQATERERMFRGIMDWLGFRKVYIEFRADARNEGAAGYSYAKLWSLAVNSITSFSLWPLRITGYLGVVITAVSGGLLIWMLGSYLLGNKAALTPIAIVVVANTFLIGIVLIAIGLVALYIGTIHTEVVNRPLYIVRERINFEEKVGN